MSIGDTIAAAQAANRMAFGTPLVVGGRTVWAVRGQTERADQMLREGGVNVAARDLCVFNCTPADFPGPPAPGTALMWHDVAYEVLLALPEDAGGVTVALNVYCYRTPDAAPDPSDAAQVALWPAPPAP